MAPWLVLSRLLVNRGVLVGLKVPPSFCVALCVRLVAPAETHPFCCCCWAVRELRRRAFGFPGAHVVGCPRRRGSSTAPDVKSVEAVQAAGECPCARESFQAWLFGDDESSLRRAMPAEAGSADLANRFMRLPQMAATAEVVGSLPCWFDGVLVHVYPDGSAGGTPNAALAGEWDHEQPWEGSDDGEEETYFDAHYGNVYASGY